MCGVEVNHSIIFIYSFLDLLPGCFLVDREGVGDELLLPSSGQYPGNTIYSDTPQVLLEGFLQCGGLLWFGSQCFAASVSFLSRVRGEKAA